MKHHFVDRLVCPVTGSPLTLEVHEEKNGEVKEGKLSGPEGRNYPVTNYVPRFVDADRYVASFGQQRELVRQHFESYRQDRSGFELFHATTGFSQADLLPGVTLEVGCGYGRFLDVVQQQGGEVVGIDLSTPSIELAQTFVGLRPNVHLVQCDLFHLPFRRDSFHAIYSIGVLHHTPDCRSAFATLPPYLAPAGRISIWLYHPADQANVVSWRKFTTRWSPRLLYTWCIINQICFSWIRRIPVVRWKFSRLVPGSPPGHGRRFWLRVMEDFDNLSPTYASSHTPEEVVGWFHEAGLQNVQALDRLTAVTGARPDFLVR